LRAAPPVEKNIVVACIRSDLKQADGAERLAAAAKTVTAKSAEAKPAASRIAAAPTAARGTAKSMPKTDKSAAKTVAKDADKTAVKPTARKRIKTAHVGQETPPKVAQQ
jgi:hypothetical protein